MIFSIIIPVYNVAPYLRECLDSVLVQTYDSWEAICVDDGSTDGSGAILDEYAAKDNRFRVIHQVNAGVSAARNAGLAVATGNWIAFVDGDDVVTPLWLEVAKGVIDNENVDLVRMRFTYWDDGTPKPIVRLEEGRDVFRERSKVLEWGWPEFLQRGWSWLLFIRRANMCGCPGCEFPVGLPYREDNIFTLKLLSTIQSAVQCQYAGYLYRQRIGSAVCRSHSPRDIRLLREQFCALWCDTKDELMGLRNFSYIKTLYEIQLRLCAAGEWRWNPFRLMRRAQFHLYSRYWPSWKIRNVCFLLPGPDSGPVGGYKVVYEYANRFAAAGWNVTIAYSLFDHKNGLLGVAGEILRHPRSRLISYGRVIRHVVVGRFKGVSWFKIDPRVRRIYPMAFTDRFSHRFPAGTRFVSTFVWTAIRLNGFTADCRKFQFLQDYEAWNEFTPEMLSDIYRYDMTKIAISEWLCEKVRAAGSEAVYVPNGLDIDYFKMTNPIESRRSTEIAMLWHDQQRKRTEDALAALKMVHEMHPDLHVTAFGTPDMPSDLPEWFTYHQRPDRATHNAIYNAVAIFVASSEQEGWGLTPCEAMQCGAAVACTDIGGYRSFAKDGETALMSPVRDVKALAANICRLIEDDALRIRIANAGHENIQQFTWERSFDKMRGVLER